MVLTVRIGDIAAAADIDVAVVSANTRLDLEGGGARALAKACGPSLAAELAAARTRGAVRVPDIVPTGAGHHPSLRRILWAVIRDYERTTVDDDGDDLAAIETALRQVWADIVALAAGRPLRVGIIPLGALDVGIAASAALLASTLAIARVPPTIAVTLWTTDARHVDTLERTVARQRIEDAGAALSATPPPMAPPLPGPVAARPTTSGIDVAPAIAAGAPALRARSKREVIGDAVVETFDRCAGAAPVGCAGVLFRVRRGGSASQFKVDVQGAGVVEDLAIDAVPVGTQVALHDGPHALTCLIQPNGTPFWFTAGLAGARALRSGTAVRVSSTAPAAGWRQVDFNDDDWPALVRSSHLITLPPGVPATGPLWLRWSFTLAPKARG